VTARDDLYDALVEGDGRLETQLRAARLLDAHEAEVRAPLEAQVARVRAFLEDMAGWCSPHGIAADYARRGLDVLDGVDTLGVDGAATAPAGDGFRWHVLSACPDETACPIHGLNEEPAVEGQEDGVELPELTTEDAVEAMQDMAQELYTAEDRLAFIAEMCDQADRDGTEVTTERVRTWLAYNGCGGAIVLPDDVQASLAESLGFAMDAMKPTAEPVFCHHPNRRIQWRRAGRLSIATATCPDCPARAEQADAEPALAPWLLNAGRCSDACSEQHTYRPGCQIAPDWGRKP
jgi:hypothetical protein